jgi:cell wall-associated NlpC family hydrolase
MNLNFLVKFAFIVAIALIISSCASSVRFTSDRENSRKTTKTEKPENNFNNKDVSNDPFSNKLIEEAEAWLGTPYRYGGESRNGVDCSGFVLQVYTALGVQIPRTSNQQYDYVKKINFDEKKTGDLIFFSKNSKINHVGIYLGSGEMIHASSSNGVVKQSIYDNYFEDKIAGIGRVK